MLLVSDVVDCNIISNHDWDTSYLYEIFKEDFFEFGGMSISQSTSDSQICENVQQFECQKYSPEVGGHFIRRRHFTSCS